MRQFRWTPLATTRSATRKGGGGRYFTVQDFIIQHCREAGYDKQLEAFKSIPQYGDYSTLKDRRPELHFELYKKLSDIRSTKTEEIFKSGGLRA